MKKEVVVISVGGSTVIPNKIDIKFLKSLRKLIKSYLKKYKFILITGGGKTCRNYQKAAASVIKVDSEDLDWIGIHSTRLNGHLLRTIFRDVACPRLAKNPTKKLRFDKVLIGAGWKPGASTDYDAVLLAKTYGSKTVINLTDVDYLYNKNPKKYKNAHKIEKINWKGFRKIVGNKWTPGLNAPFDPVASKLAQKLNIRVILLGNKLENLRKFLNNKKFKGSIIED